MTRQRQKSPPAPKIETPADLAALVRAERAQREAACLKEIQAAIQPILKKHNCESRIQAQWVIVARELQSAPD